MTILSMIFFHIVDDYYLQGSMKQSKQTEWWRLNAPDELYKYDYIWILLTHAFSWTFLTMLPVMIVMSFELTGIFGIFFVINVIIHAYVDNLKANKLKINLITDQIIHLIQIIVTYTVLCVILQ